MTTTHDAIDPTGILDDFTYPENYVQDSELEELSKRLNKEFLRAYEARQPYENDWELYRLYLKGEQLIVRSRDTGEIVRLVNEDVKRLRSVHNVLRPTARSLVGKLTRSIPTCTVVPSTTDFEEQHAARVGDFFFQWLRRKEELDLKYVNAHEYLPWAGNAFFELNWDEQGGETVAYCPVCNFYEPNKDVVGQPCPRCVMQRQQEIALQQHMTQDMLKKQAGEDVQAEMESGEPVPPADMPPLPMPQMGPLPQNMEPPPLIEANEGTVSIELHDSRHIYPEPGAESLEEAQWVCVRKGVPTQEARKKFPQFQHVIKSEEDIFADQTSEIRFNSVDSYGGVDYLRDYCYVYKFFERPTQMYPEGRIISMVNSKIVDEKPMRHDWYGRFPLYRFGFDKNCGEFWYEPPLAQSWPLQREINQIQTQKREHVELICKPKLLDPIGSRISADEFTATTAQVIKYNAAAGNPQFLYPAPLPNDVWSRDTELTQNIRSQFGVTDQEAGVTPNDPNGRAMAIIDAEAIQQLRSVVIRNNSEWRALHKGALIMVQKMMRPERKFTIAGPDGAQTYSFEQMNLTGDYDVQIEEEDGLSRNPAVRLTQAADLANLGYYMDPATGVFDKKAFSRHANLKRPESGYDHEASERAAASQIPYNFKKGIPHQPQMWDLPHIFAEELEGWLRGPGRREDQIVVQQVAQVWMFYVQWAMAAQAGQPPPPMRTMGGSGRGGPDQSAQGGSTNNPGHLGTDLRFANDQTDLRSQAAGQVAQANRAAENLAQVQSRREG